MSVRNNGSRPRREALEKLRTEENISVLYGSSAQGDVSLYQSSLSVPIRKMKVYGAENLMTAVQ